MNLNKITEKDQQILKYLAQKGPSWYYQLSEVEKIASNKTVLKAFKHLEELKLIEIKTEKQTKFMGRKRTYYGLTFKGLVYALNVGFVKPSEAAEKRQKYNVRMPQKYDYPGFGSLNLSHLEDQFQPLLEGSCLLEFKITIDKIAEEQSRVFEKFIRRHKGVEPVLSKETERRYSELIYSEILDKVNLNRYNEKWVGFLYHMLLLRAQNELFQEAMQKKGLTIITDCLKKDKVSQELTQKVFLPYLISITEMMIRNSYLRLGIPKRVLRESLKTLRKLEKVTFKKLANDFSKLNTVLLNQMEHPTSDKLGNSH